MINLPLYNPQTGGKALVAVDKKAHKCDPECFLYPARDEYGCGFMACDATERTDGKNVVFKIIDVPPKLDCANAEKTSDGKCRGYQKSSIDDEPADMCMHCKDNEFYEEEA